MYKRQLEDFVLHIFNQPKESAYRRNRVLWGDIYYQKCLQGKHYYDRMMELDHLYSSTLEYNVRHYWGKIKNHLFSVK